MPEDLESIDTLAPRMRAHKFPVIGLMLLDSNNSDGRSSLCTKIGFRFVLRLHMQNWAAWVLDDQLLCLELAAGSA